LLAGHGKYEQAFTDVNRAIRLKGDEPEYYVNRGSMLGEKGDYDKAIADLNKAIGLNPKSSMAYINRCRVNKLLSHYDAAIADGTKAVELDPQNAWGYTNRGAAFFAKGDGKHAIADYSQALKISPNLPEANSGLAICLSTSPDPHLRDGKRALIYATKACELTQWKNPKFFRSLGEAYAENGDFEHAIEWEKKFLNLWTGVGRKTNVRLKNYSAHQPWRNRT
ncbi:MAG TPA: tetratricopeptide repeat protein, partial [Chthoniobacterales bacterium]|nr:tetratricopeptide repeat protein [Chthoniobacterales bacterium]